ncbi:hypothetical protein CHS0354_039850 [Potamilus streckersoni]|uniref:Uncharacterized protein n=1 Tax=Potamilus streckersoni TaxID=2493646 RepID=A0AAE0SRE7_9BIVA|nr:hypothetical protein CHS0354_039850 [Potamilus streckersoni]
MKDDSKGTFVVTVIYICNMLNSSNYGHGKTLYTRQLAHFVAELPRKTPGGHLTHRAFWQTFSDNHVSQAETQTHQDRVVRGPFKGRPENTSNKARIIDMLCLHKVHLVSAASVPILYEIHRIEAGRKKRVDICISLKPFSESALYEINKHEICYQNIPDLL